MIYITGDTHRDIDWHKMTTKKFPIGKTLTKDDYVIILGDFGAIWDGKPDDEKSDAFFLNWYQKKPWTTLFIDGNHENHESLNQYPTEKWNGGFIHRIRPSVIHLMRGQVFTINGKKFFTMGGATSTDKKFRTPHKSWWEEEMPTYEQTCLAEENLAKHNNTVDYILTHTCPAHVHQSLYGNMFVTPDSLEQWFDQIYLHTHFTHWYFGHHHIDQKIKYNITAVYDDILPINEKNETHNMQQ